MDTLSPTPANSSPPSSKNDDIAHVLNFLREREAGVTRGGLRLEDADDHLLHLLAQAREHGDQSTETLASSPDQLHSCREQRPGNPFVVFAHTLRQLRVRFILPTSPQASPVLVLRPMITAVHSSIQVFVNRCVLSRKRGLLRALVTDDELEDIQAVYYTQTPLPRAPVDGGFRDPAALIKAHRTKKRAIMKEPDVAMSYVPLAPEPTIQGVASNDGSLDHADQKDDDDDAAAGDDGHEEEPAAARPPDLLHPVPGEAVNPVPVFPSLVIEVGYAETYEDLVSDCHDYLLSSGGHIHLAILISIKNSQPRIKRPEDLDPSHPPRAHPRPSLGAEDLTNTPSTMESSSPDSNPDDYIVRSDEMWMQRQSAPPLDAFIECWELTPATTKHSLTDGPDAPRVPRLRCPRIWLFKNGRAMTRVKVPMCRPDFGLSERNVGKQQLGAQDTFVKVNWTAYTGVLKTAWQQLEVSRALTDSKIAKANKRVRQGDVGGDYVPEVGDGIDGSDEPENDVNGRKGVKKGKRRVLSSTR